ncbi:glycosyltransferase 87 family protein (plasmid) [Streptomyces sp. BI20]|uniref:glycosyltransferase 87 family protein n=1 Tax=Streptomyces sp. BI20 TaxID=3403460 RepID=UPI003C78550E
MTSTDTSTPGAPTTPGRLRSLAGGPTTTAAATRRQSAAMAGVWLLTRVVMLVLLALDGIGVRGVSREVHDLYQSWYRQLAEGWFPVGDVTWQYPPGAAGVMLSADLLPFLTFFQSFVALTVLCDALVTLALLRAARRPDGSRDGAWAWVIGLPLLLSIPFARYDVQTTAFAVLALLAVRYRPRLAGVAAGLGAMVKVWPALTLLGTPRGRTTRQAWTSAVAAGAGVLLFFTVFFDGAWDFLDNQEERGIQIESVGGTALQLAKHLGDWSGYATFQYGAMEFVGPGVPTIATLSLVATVLAFAWLLLWRVLARRWTTATPFDAALTAVLLFTVTSRVISPQYMIWLLGLAAVCLTCRHTTQRPIALLLLAATLVSVLAFPISYNRVIASDLWGTTLMVVRNGLLLTAAGWSAARLWRSAIGPEPTPRPLT